MPRVVPRVCPRGAPRCVRVWACGLPGWRGGSPFLSLSDMLAGVVPVPWARTGAAGVHAHARTNTYCHEILYRIIRHYVTGTANGCVHSQRVLRHVWAMAACLGDGQKQSYHYSFAFTHLFVPVRCLYLSHARRLATQICGVNSHGS